MLIQSSHRNRFSKARLTISAPMTIKRHSTWLPINSSRLKKSDQEREMSRPRAQTHLSLPSPIKGEGEGQESMNQRLLRATRRIVFVAASEVEILDLVGPLQVFARAAE